MQVNLNTTDPYHAVFRGQRGTLVNLDPKNSILIGPGQGDVFSGNPACWTLGPLNTGYSDGTEDLWAIGLTGTPAIQFLPGIQSWTASPAQVQAQLLSATTVLRQVPPTVIAAASSTNTGGSLPITQTGYEISLTLQDPAAATVQGARIDLVWSDSVSGLIVEQQSWLLAAATAPNAQRYIGTGPTDGDTLSITITNLDPAQTLSYSLSIAQNSRTYARHDWRQTTVFPINTITSATYDQQANYLFSANPTIASGATASRWVPLYAGDVTLQVNNGANANSQISLNTFLETTLANPVFYTSPLLAANGVLNTKVTLSRETCELNILNGSGTSQPISVNIIISEQQP